MPLFSLQEKAILRLRLKNSQTRYYYYCSKECVFVFVSCFVRCVERYLMTRREYKCKELNIIITNK